MKIAIVSVAFNRLLSITRLISSLQKADYESDKVDLIISIDKSNTDVVESYADEVSWPYGEKIVVKHEKNLGLRAHIMSQGKHFQNYDALVILEDDIIVSPLFYHYTKQALTKYQNNKDIAGISLYAYYVNYQNNLPFEPIKTEFDAYFMQCAMSWGQVWMKNQWMEFYEWYQNHLDFDYSPAIPQSLYGWPKSSWLKYHIRYCIENKKYFVYPYFSLVTDFSDVGTHNDDATNNTVYQVPMQRGNKTDFNFPETPNDSIRYDGFFENESIAHVLGVAEDDLCIDLYGTRGNKTNNRFWLTTSIQNYKIVKSFGINYRPIECNIIEENAGHQIFLYDTSIVEKNPYKEHNLNVLFRFYIQTTFTFMRIYGIKGYFTHPIIITFKKIIKTVIKKLINDIRRF